MSFGHHHLAQGIHCVPSLAPCVYNDGYKRPVSHLLMFALSNLRSIKNVVHHHTCRGFLERRFVRPCAFTTSPFLLPARPCCRTEGPHKTQPNPFGICFLFLPPPRLSGPRERVYRVREERDTSQASQRDARLMQIGRSGRTDALQCLNRDGSSWLLCLGRTSFLDTFSRLGLQVRQCHKQ